MLQLPEVFTLLDFSFWIHVWVAKSCSLIVFARPTGVLVIILPSAAVVVVIAATFFGEDGVWEACVERSVLHYVLEHG